MAGRGGVSGSHSFSEPSNSTASNKTSLGDSSADGESVAFSRSRVIAVAGADLGSQLCELR